MHTLSAHLPLTRVVATSGPVTLRLPEPFEIAAFVDRIAAGGIDDDRSRASLTWRPATPERAARDTLEHLTKHLTAATRDDWLLPFVVFVNGEPIGRQDISAAGNFEHLRTVKTGSYLLNGHRDAGYGTHARACGLAVAFAIGARRAATSWRCDNAASRRVSEKLGYQYNGIGWWWDDATGEEVELQHAYVTRAAFEAARPSPVDITGVDNDVLAWFAGEPPSDALSGNDLQDRTVSPFHRTAD